MRHPSTLVLLVCICSLFMACHQSEKDRLIGKWAPVGVDNKYISSYHLSSADIKGMISQNSIEFTKDGKVISVDGSDTSRGTYLYDEKTKTLVLDGEGGKTLKFSVEMQNENMVVGNDFGKMTFSKK